MLTRGSATHPVAKTGESIQRGGSEIQISHSRQQYGSTCRRRRPSNQARVSECESLAFRQNLFTQSLRHRDLFESRANDVLPAALGVEPFVQLRIGLDQA